MSQHHLKLSNLSFGYKKTLTKEINLSIHENEFITIMGENGCGKTTLIDCLMGLHKPYSGSITFWGEVYEDSSIKNINQKVGWVISQKENYPLHLNVEQYLKIVSQTYKHWNWTLNEKLCHSFELDKKKRLSHLSMGENSKVRLVRALSFKPALIILDELTANLSPKSKDSLTKELIRLFSSEKMSILYICHSNEEALRLSDRISWFCKIQESRFYRKIYR
ncbi:MAG: ABC transporter ATP-binding protein [Bdellovibrionota bacterium]